MRKENDELLSRAAKYCSIAERCRKDVRDKLDAWGMKEGDIQTALDQLERQQFIDEKRYTEYFIRDKLKFNHWGRVKIAFALRNKHIPADIIESGLGDIEEEEYLSILDKLINQKARSIGDIHSARGRGKLMRFAAQRGFTSEEIYGAIQRLNEGS